MSAITSYPLVLLAVGTAARQSTLYLTPLHAQADLLRELIVNIGSALQNVKASAEQIKDRGRWGYLLRYISNRIPPIIPPRNPALGSPTTG